MPKTGFLTPLNDWLKRDKFYGEVKDEFNSSEADEFFNIEYINKLLDDHREGKAKNMKRIWSVYSFLLWYRRYFIEEK